MKDNLLIFDGERQHFSAIAELPADIAEWQSFPVNSDSDSLIVKAGDKRVLINSVNDNGVALNANAWDRWISEHQDQKYSLEAYSTPRNPITVSRLYLASHLKICKGFELRQVLVGRDSAADLPVQDFDLSLGLQALGQLIMVVDGANAVCYVRQTGVIPAFPDYNRLGAVFTPEDIRSSDRLIATVAPGSPAARAGIRDADQILRIDALDVTKWRTRPGILPLGRFWSQPSGTQLTLQLARGSNLFQVQVALQDLFSGE